MDVKTDEYQIRHDPETHTVICQGDFLLNGVAEYQPLVDILNKAAASQPQLLTLDLRELQFLNSSGINVLSKFVLATRKSGTIGLRVLGSKAIPWQSKTLVNLKRLMPSLELTIE